MWHRFGSDFDYHEYFRGPERDEAPELEIRTVPVKHRDMGDEDDRGAVPEADPMDYRQRTIDQRWGR